MLSSITLAQRDVFSIFYLTAVDPQSFSPWPAFILVVMAYVCGTARISDAMH
ncbi:hypothetical protein [Yoonia maricola]|nr:hypothetical protein [Yoonia maricola]